MSKQARTPRTGRKRQPRPAEAPKGKITAERAFKASLEEVWDLWTTSAGIESWWGPDGFVTKVRRLDLRPGGQFEYAMKATEESQIESLMERGLPLTSIGRATYTEISPRLRIAYTTTVDFVPGVAPYIVSTVVDFRGLPSGVKLTLTQDAMHDSQWTQQAALGLHQQLNRLVKVAMGRQSA